MIVAIVRCDSCGQQADLIVAESGGYRRPPAGWESNPDNPLEWFCPWGCAERLIHRPKHMRAPA